MGVEVAARALWVLVVLLLLPPLLPSLLLLLSLLFGGTPPCLLCTLLCASSCCRCRWRSEIQDVDVIVMTPELLLHCLAHAAIKVGLVGLGLRSECDELPALLMAVEANHMHYTATHPFLPATPHPQKSLPTRHMRRFCPQHHIMQAAAACSMLALLTREDASSHHPPPFNPCPHTLTPHPQPLCPTTNQTTTTDVPDRPAGV